MRRHWYVIVGMLVGWVGMVPAQLPATTNDPPAELVLHERPIVTLRATVYGVSPSDRVARVQARFQNALRDRAEGRVDLLLMPGGLVLTLDEKAIMAIAKEDLDPASGESLSAVASNAMLQVAAAYWEMSAAHSVRARVSGVLYAVGATVLFGLLIYGLRQERYWVTRLAESLAPMLRKYYPKPVELAHRIMLGINWIIGVVAGLVWISFVLGRFPETQRVGRQLGDYMLGAVATVGRLILSAIPELLVATLIFIVARFLVQFIRWVAARVTSGRMQLPAVDATTARPTSRILITLIWLFAVVMAYPYLPGTGTDAFKGVGMFVGLLVSLGASGVVGQVLGGLVMMYTRFVRVGDFVRIGEQEGTVIGIGFLSLRLRTVRNVELNYPNALLMGTTILNFSRGKDTVAAQMLTSVSIGYDTPWRQVHALLLQAAARTPGLRTMPAPQVLQSSLADFYVVYDLVVSLEQPDQRPFVLSALHGNIQDEFNAYGVQIMSPHYRIGTTGPVVVPKDKWFSPPATQPAEQPAQ